MGAVMGGYVAIVIGVARTSVTDSWPEWARWTFLIVATFGIGVLRVIDHEVARKRTDAVDVMADERRAENESMARDYNGWRNRTDAGGS